MRNKLTDHISNIMSKRNGIFNENFISFFQVQEKPETCRNSNFNNCRRPSFGDDTNVKSISQQLYIFYNFYQIKRRHLSKRIPYLAQTFNCLIKK